jgi:hypothetical protein
LEIINAAKNKTTRQARSAHNISHYSIEPDASRPNGGIIVTSANSGRYSTSTPAHPFAKLRSEIPLTL